MHHLVRKGWPLGAGLVIYAVLVAWILMRSLEMNEGHLVYAVDDAYIHMAMAKNVARHGVWGVTRYEFTASSSSPLWTLLLAGFYRIFGVSDVTPLVLNVLLGLATLVLVDRTAARMHAAHFQRMLAHVAVIWMAPLPFLTFIGMEHLLHTVLVLACLGVLMGYMMQERADRNDPRGDRRRQVQLACLALLLVATRYESVVLLLGVCLLLAARRRAAAAMSTGIAAVAPIVAVGAFNVLHGWYFLPASVALKGFGVKSPIRGGLPALWRSFVGHYELLPQVTALTVVALLFIVATLIAKRTSSGEAAPPPEVTWLLGLWLVTAGIHMALLFGGGEAMDLRYCGYLTVAGCALVIGAPWLLLRRVLRAFLAERMHLSRLSVCIVYAAFSIAVVLPILRMAGALADMTPGGTIRCTDNIYRQQFQMARLAARLPPGTTVALNDIGAVAYYSDTRILDLIGLATNFIARERLKLRPGELAGGERVIAAAMAEARPRLVMVYAHNFEGYSDSQRVQIGRIWEPSVPGLLPQSLVPLGRWFTPRNLVCAGNVVSFFAGDANDMELRRLFEEITATLPSDMITIVFDATPSNSRRQEHQTFCCLR